jgi:hypothetical protein
MVFWRKKINLLAGKYLKKAFLIMYLYNPHSLSAMGCCLLHVAWTGTVMPTNAVSFYLWMPQYAYLAKEKDN